MTDTVDALCDEVNRLVSKLRPDEVPDALEVIADAERRLRRRLDPALHHDTPPATPLAENERHG